MEEEEEAEETELGLEVGMVEFKGTIADGLPSEARSFAGFIIFIACKDSKKEEAGSETLGWATAVEEQVEDESEAEA